MAAAASKSTASAKTASSDVEDLQAEITQLKKEIADLTKHISRIGDKSVRTARTAASAKADELRAQGEAVFDELRESALGYEKQLTDTVREKPITSLAMAAGLGFFLALIARR